MKVEKRSPVPLYYQLADWIRARIRSGELKEGEQLPSELALGERAGVSRMTARQAIAYLAREGLLTVRPGVGTFVAVPKLTYDALDLLGFSKAISRQGGAVTSNVIEQRTVTCGPNIVNRLNLAAEERAVKVARLRLVDAVPLLLETSFVPTSLCPGLENEDLTERSLYELMEQRYGLCLDRSRHAFEARVASEYEQRLLGIDSGTCVIVMEGVTYAERDRPVEYCEAIYRSDRFRFVVESHRNARVNETPDSPRVSAVLVGREDD